MHDAVLVLVTVSEFFSPVYWNLCELTSRASDDASVCLNPLLQHTYTVCGQYSVLTTYGT